VYLPWLLSALSALGLVAWLIRPAWVRGLLEAGAQRVGGVWRRLARVTRWHEEDG
jgi:hypothetical protein